MHRLINFQHKVIECGYFALFASQLHQRIQKEHLIHKQEHSRNYCGTKHSRLTDHIYVVNTFPPKYFPSVFGGCFIFFC